MKIFLFSCKILTLVIVFSNMTFAQEVNQQDQPPAGWFNLPRISTQLKIGGYVKFDLIHDFNPIGSPDFFDPSSIPTDGASGSTTHLNAKETRLLLDVISQTKIGKIRAYAEGDFYGAGGSFRLRHAFIEIKDQWLAGQWWSNFMDESIIPATLDFEKPAAYAFLRHPMLRYKVRVSDSYIAIAVEEPSKVAEQPAESGEFFTPFPDLTVRYRLDKHWGHFQVSGFIGQLQYRFDNGEKDNLALYGFNISGKLNVVKRDEITYQAVYGPGIGRYRGGPSADLDGDGNIEALTDLGLTFGYKHFWHDQVTSLLVYNFGNKLNTDGQLDGDLSSAGYLALNTIWNFLDNAFVGIEYLRGFRENIDDERGVANRLQLSVKYTIN